MFNGVLNKFPGSSLKSVGGLIFLRLLCPSLMQPSQGKPPNEFVCETREPNDNRNHRVCWLSNLTPNRVCAELDTSKRPKTTNFCHYFGVYFGFEVLILTKLVGAVNQRVQRGLMGAIKMLQNMANQIEFGQKELFMVHFNPLLEELTPKIQTFIQSLVSHNLTFFLTLLFRVGSSALLTQMSTCFLAGMDFLLLAGLTWECRHTTERSCVNL